jgi:hypothetical protein
MGSNQTSTNLSNHTECLYGTRTPPLLVNGNGRSCDSDIVLEVGILCENKNLFKVGGERVHCEVLDGLGCFGLMRFVRVRVTE